MASAEHVTAFDAAEDIAQARALLALNRPCDAGAYASRATVVDPSDAGGWLVLGQCYNAVGDYQQALESVTRSLECDPMLVSAHILHSNVLHSLKRRKQARSAARQAVSVAPHNVDAHANLVMTLSRDENVETHYMWLPKHLREARRHAQRAIDLEPSNTAGYFSAAYAAAAAKRMRAARKYYRQVLEMSPNDAGAINNLALIDQQRGRLIRGSAGFAKALEADPDNVTARQNAQRTVIKLLTGLTAAGAVVYLALGARLLDNLPLPGDTYVGPEAGPLTISWSTECTAAVIAVAVLAIITAVVYRMLPPAIRAIAAQTVADPGIRMALTLKAGIVVCLFIALMTRGRLASNAYTSGAAAFVIISILYGESYRRPDKLNAP